MGLDAHFLLAAVPVERRRVPGVAGVLYAEAGRLRARLLERRAQRRARDGAGVGRARQRRGRRVHGRHAAVTVRAVRLAGRVRH